MGIVRNQSIKNSIYFYIGMAIGAISTVFVYPNVFHENPDHWGLIQILVSYAMVISTFSHFGIPKIFIRFFPAVTDKSQLYLLSFIMTLLGFFLVCLVYFSFQETILNSINATDLLRDNFLYVVLLIFCISFYELFTSISRSYLNSATPIFLNEIFLKGYTLLILIIHGIGIIDFNKFLIFYVLGYASKLVILCIIQFKNNRLQWANSLNSLQIKRLMSFGLFVIVGGASAMLVARVDMLMLGILKDLEQVAYYALAFFIGNSIKVPGRSIITISTPLIAKAWEENDLKKIYLIYKKSAITQLLIGGLFFVCIWLSIEEVFRILPEKFSNGKYVVFFVGLSQLFNISTGVNGAIIINSRYYRYDLLFTVCLLIITIIANYLFIPSNWELFGIPISGINGAALATSISVFIFNTVKLIFLKVKMNIQPFDIKTIYSILLLLITYFLIDAIPLFGNMYIDLIIRSLLAITFFIPLMIRLELSEDINDMYFELKKKFLPF